MKYEIIVQDKLLWSYTIEAGSAAEAKKQVQDVIDGIDDETELDYRICDQGYSEIIGEPELICKK
jgi:hypothetical protein